MAVSTETHAGPDDGGNFEFHWSSPYVHVHLLSDVGKKRSRNEDSCVLCLPLSDEHTLTWGYLIAVADGMGGASGGAYASKLALQSLAEEYFSAPDKNIPNRLRRAVESANRRIFEEAERNPDYHGMGTTVSALLIAGDSAYIAQVGDSRVYLFREPRTIWQITNDHSLVAEQVRNGYISEEEARTHALKNLITRAVGTKDNIKVDLFSMKIKQDDMMLICSDGLSNLVDEVEISGALALDNLQGAARRLIGKALEGGGPDNITAVVIRIVQQPPKTELDEGAEKVGLQSTGILGRIKRLIS